VVGVWNVDATIGQPDAFSITAFLALRRRHRSEQMSACGGIVPLAAPPAGFPGRPCYPAMRTVGANRMCRCRAGASGAVGIGLAIALGCWSGCYSSAADGADAEPRDLGVEDAEDSAAPDPGDGAEGHVVDDAGDIGTSEDAVPDDAAPDDRAVGPEDSGGDGSDGTDIDGETCDAGGVTLLRIVPDGYWPGYVELDLPDEPSTGMWCSRDRVMFHAYATDASGVETEATADAAWVSEDPSVVLASPIIPGLFWRQERTGSTHVTATYACTTSAPYSVSVALCHGP